MMKLIYLGLLFMLCPLFAIKKPKQKPLELTSQTQMPKKETTDEDKECTKRVLSTFSQMLTNFMSIVQDPKNPAVVGVNLTALFAGMVNIAMEMFRRQDVLDETVPLLELTDLDQQMIEKIKKQLIIWAQQIEQNDKELACIY